MRQAVVRRIAGTAIAVLLIALGTVAIERAFAPPADSFEVEAIFGRAGSGLTVGSDVKVRGLRVGKVSHLDYQDGTAVGRLRINPGHEIPRTGLTMVVTAKTLLGEKQVELDFPDEQFGTEPVLAAGDVLEASRQPTELQETIAAIEPFLAAIDAQEFATIVDVLGQQQGEGPTIRRSLETTSELSEWAARTADQNIANLRRLTSIADQLAPAAGEFDRLNRALPDAVALIYERTGDIQSNLDVLTTFAATITTYLEVEEDRIRTTLATGDVVGAFLEKNMAHFGSFVEGTAIYFNTLGRPTDLLSDGSTYGAFKIFLDLSQLGLPIGNEGPLDLNDLFQVDGGEDGDG